ncbi:GerAB/ArcD/ProY family transporter [Candidatus Woesearchaeota archaeon]|jgi:amino acid permease|nr:GerAB/ArcD/ProY family transporter [Candidatus Woesearchaeota archaeon]MBT4835479.1 GerAB/ArcD/ProY family transporter [Candidatus Woesearchaeota archaeon]MBT6734829.1 GerAB/ArcD/ProY family transporter [Candidatus Woesearchaeota archaeon]MBT7169842.1 GerAB/ArcD/ProY family transporter [Candidatus Woesearchaeota archaeon]MBT7474614.1 GerAB/ArcD/ProY family transporter [Candidatus Woesearchaeota archaeon]
MESLKTLRATALLTGTVIGAGVLGIPFAIAKAGFLTGLLMIVLLGAAMLILNLFFGEIILRTSGSHQFSGYAERYLGKWGKYLASFALFFGIYGALIAYMVGEGEALSAIFGLKPIIFTLIFFVLVAAIVFKGLEAISKSEIYLLSIVLLLVAVISVITISSGKFDISNLTTFNIYHIFIPFGVILFAFRGFEAIPEMREYLQRDRKKLKKAIIIGSLIPLVVYIIFAFATLGITGANTTEIVTIGLGESLGEGMLILGSLFAIFAMLTSFLTLSLAMKEIYMFDYKLSPNKSWALTMFIPIIIILAGATDFIKVIGITGALSGGIEGIIIVLMHRKARKHGNRVPEFKLGKKTGIGLFLILLFILGIIYQILQMIK